jgi:NADPH:quinone reductase-like Zn-dependent oxidoreductase
MNTEQLVAPREGSSQGGATAGEGPSDGLMQAIVQVAYGAEEVLHLDRVAPPQIADNEVLVRVHAAGLDRGTWHLMTGRPYLMRVIGFGFTRPKNPVPGIDVAGVVVAAGASVTRFQIGDEVFGIAKGSFAQYASALEEKLALKPASLSFEQAAVVPVSAMTALQGLTDVGHLEPGQRVLVIGASGGVGSYAVQIAKAMGAVVTGVASTSKLDLVRSLGADHVIDYTCEDYADGTRQYDLVLDIGGNPALSRLRRALAPGGTAVIIGGEQGGNVTGGFGRSLRAPLVSLFVKQRLAMVTTKERGSDLERLTPMLEAGTVKPSLDRTYPLAQVPAAMRHLVAGHVRGKVAITL